MSKKLLHIQRVSRRSSSALSLPLDVRFSGRARLGHVGPFVLLVQDGLLLDVNLEGRLLALRQADEIADLALQADVGDEALAGLRVDPRQVPRVGVAVGVAVGDLEEIDDVVASSASDYSLLNLLRLGG